MIKSRLLGAVSACMLVLFTSSSNAALVSVLGGQAVYDSDLNITWTADMRLAISNTFGTSGINASFGKMNWSTANTWISNMNAANYLGFNDWRLPTFANPDSSCTNDTAGTTPSSGPDGYNCTGSELGHLFYTEFGAGAGTFLSATGNSTTPCFLLT